MPTCRVRMSQSHQARPLRPPDQAESSSTSVSRPREAQGPLWPRPSRGVPGERGAAETLPQCSPPHVHSATTPGGGETQAGKSNPFPSVNKSYAFAHASGGRRTGCPPPPTKRCRPRGVGPEELTGHEEETEGPRGHSPRGLLGPKTSQRLPKAVTRLLRAQPEADSGLGTPSPRVTPVTGWEPPGAGAASSPGRTRQSPPSPHTAPALETQPWKDAWGGQDRSAPAPALFPGSAFSA